MNNDIKSISSHQLQKKLIVLDLQYSGYAAENFSVDGSKNVHEKDSSKKLQGYKCVLNSKAAEESMVRNQLSDND